MVRSKIMLAAALAAPFFLGACQSAPMQGKVFLRHYTQSELDGAAVAYDDPMCAPLRPMVDEDRNLRNLLR